MVGIQPGDHFPRDVRDCVAAGNRLREVDLNRIDTRDVVHDNADRNGGL
jgi:hypothetical protein